MQPQSTRTVFRFSTLGKAAAIAGLVLLASCGVVGGQSAPGQGSEHHATPVNAQSSAKAITAFSLAGVTGTINETDKTIAVTLPLGTGVTALVATFFTTKGASIAVGATTQISGSSMNDFTNPLSYTATAADGTTVNYTVTVVVPTEFDLLRDNAEIAMKLGEAAEKRVRDKWKNLEWTKSSDRKIDIGSYVDDPNGLTLTIHIGETYEYFGEAAVMNESSFGCGYTYGQDKKKGYLLKHCGQSKGRLFNGWGVLKQAGKIDFLEYHNGQMNGLGLICQCQEAQCINIVNCKEQWHSEGNLTSDRIRKYSFPPSPDSPRPIVEVAIKSYQERVRREEAKLEEARRDQAKRAEAFREETRRDRAKRDHQVDACVVRGVALFKEIGSYPTLRSFPNKGIRAEDEARTRCNRTTTAF